MSDTPLGTYSLPNVRLIVDGFDIAAGGEADDAISFENGAPAFIAKVMINGNPVVSTSNDDSMTATVTVSELSAAYKRLNDICNAQRQEVADGLNLSARNFQFYDPHTGDEASDQYCVVLDNPPPNKAQEAGDRQFAIFLPTAKSVAKAKRGANNPA